MNVKYNSMYYTDLTLLDVEYFCRQQKILGLC